MLSQNYKFCHQSRPAGSVQLLEIGPVTQKPLQLWVEDPAQSHATFISEFNTGLYLLRPHDPVHHSECSDPQRSFPTWLHLWFRWKKKNGYPQGSDSNELKGEGRTGLSVSTLHGLGLSNKVCLLSVTWKAQRSEPHVFWSVADIHGMTSCIDIISLGSLLGYSCSLCI